jgi:hypothetical protein
MDDFWGKISIEKRDQNKTGKLDLIGCKKMVVLKGSRDTIMKFPYIILPTDFDKTAVPMYLNERMNIIELPIIEIPSYD